MDLGRGEAKHDRANDQASADDGGVAIETAVVDDVDVVAAFVVAVAANEAAAVVDDIENLDAAGLDDHGLGGAIGALLRTDVGRRFGKPLGLIVADDRGVVLLDDDAVVGLVDNFGLAAILDLFGAPLFNVLQLLGRGTGWLEAGRKDSRSASTLGSSGSRRRCW